MKSPVTRVDGRSSKRLLGAGLCVLGALALLFPSVALAQGGPGAGSGRGQGPGGGPGWKRGGPGRFGGHWGGPHGTLLFGDFDRAKNALGLTPAQVSKLEALRKSHPAAVAKLRLEKERIHAQMKVEWLKDTLNEGAVRALHGRLLAAGQAIAQKQFEVRLSIAKLLTPEQRAKLLTLRGPGRGLGWGRGGGG
jgi:Spy/CpxP family protein refolding chaperone